jgi:hypothetical protein
MKAQKQTDRAITIKDSLQLTSSLHTLLPWSKGESHRIGSQRISSQLRDETISAAYKIEPSHFKVNHSKAPSITHHHPTKEFEGAITDRIIEPLHIWLVILLS